MDKNHTINWIVLSGDDYWNSYPHSTLHIAKRLAKKSKVLWVNSIGTRVPSLKKKNGLRLLFRKLKSYLKYFRKINNNFYVLSPVTIPFFSGKIIKTVNKKFLWFQIKLFVFLLGLKNIHFFISLASYGIIADKLKKYFCIYFYSDLYISQSDYYSKLNNNAHDQKFRSETKALDKSLFSISKLIYSASNKICETLADQNKTIRYSPHSVDVEHFQKKFAKPLILGSIKSPVIGYYGTLDYRNDWEMIDYASEKRPGYNFVFIGEKFIQLPELEKKENIYFINKILYEEVPAYGSCFDVAIMFWKLEEWIIHSNPLKLLEYIALGKPIVSVDIPEVSKNFNDVAFIAKDKYSFLEKIDQALKVDKYKLEKKYAEILRNHSWENVVKKIYDDIKEV